ncbi:hypothetical protein, partial [Brucella anthropi]|uniref:hypothetical protein n=1 Tax=Brucella anthropi TaxID=529 RepID=UPI001AEC13C0
MSAHGIIQLIREQYFPVDGEQARQRPPEIQIESFSEQMDDSNDLFSRVVNNARAREREQEQGRQGEKPSAKPVAPQP